jgi:dipicolinate synthase subunit A
MSTGYEIGIFGGDNRQVFMAASFLKKGFSVAAYGTLVPVIHENCTMLSSLTELFEQCNLLIGPIPMSRDGITIYADPAAKDMTLANVSSHLTADHLLFAGVIPPFITELCETKGIYCYDLMKDERITVLNAIATAEGAIMEAIAASDTNLHGSKCLVLGYGRCAKILAAKLKALDAHVLVAARSREALAYAEAAGLSTITLPYMKCVLSSCQYIFNTIPSLILTKDCLEYADRNVTIIDIASAPGGVDFTYAKERKLNAKLCLGLPGKVAPRTSADILVTEICTLIKERSD